MPDMSSETLELLFYRINEHLTAWPNESVLFTWHGGEPLLLGEQYFDMACEFQNKHCSTTAHRITHSIQSNLTLLTEQIIASFKRLGIHHIGSSYDPEPHMRGPGRTIDSFVYNRAFLRGTSLLEQHGMSWGIIYVVTSRSLGDPLSLFFLLTNLVGRLGLLMNPVVISSDERRSLAITPKQYADFLGAIFPHWYEHRERYPSVEPFQTIWDAVADGGHRLFCHDSGTCASSHLNIDATGKISKCGRSSDLHIMEFGTIRDHSIAECIYKSIELLEGRMVALRAEDCHGCRLFPICHGGCPIDGYVSQGSYFRKTDWCEAKQRFMFDYFEPITGIRIDNLKDNRV